MPKLFNPPNGEEPKFYDIYPHMAVYGPYDNEKYGHHMVLKNIITGKFMRKTYKRFIMETTENKIFPKNAIFILKDETQHATYDNILCTNRTELVRKRNEGNFKGNSIYVDTLQLTERDCNRNVKTEKSGLVAELLRISEKYKQQEIGTKYGMETV